MEIHEAYVVGTCGDLPYHRGFREEMPPVPNNGYIQWQIFSVCTAHSGGTDMRTIGFAWVCSAYDKYVILYQ